MTITGEALRIVRQIKGIKQQTIAKKLNISQPAYCKLEKANEINSERLQKIIPALGYSILEFQQLIAQLSQRKL